MTAKPRRCALPGCDTVIRSKTGRANLRYCCNEHRLAAQRARRKKAQQRADQPTPAGVDQRTSPEGEPTVPIPRGFPVPADPIERRSVPPGNSHARPYSPPSYGLGEAPWDIPPPRSRSGQARVRLIGMWVLAGALAVAVATAWVLGICAGG